MKSENRSSMHWILRRRLRHKARVEAVVELAEVEVVVELAAERSWIRMIRHSLMSTLNQHAAVVAGAAAMRQRQSRRIPLLH
jgi:hypothetical protein